ncbi:hypothetical protein CBER1_05079 [Cercospora berteroae]|uniref:Uncharacterized protein n=1 Tax=Cercospora berteroae TaxID=357750 RepID=A0A2S6BRH6_9PEZI|nr:hypothetical protein CBER1_05079 [Cercospora berteroae]
MAVANTLHNRYPGKRYSVAKYNTGKTTEFEGYRGFLEASSQKDDLLCVFAGVDPDEWPTEEPPALFITTDRNEPISVLDAFVRDAEAMIEARQTTDFETGARVELIPTCTIKNGSLKGRAALYYDIMATKEHPPRRLQDFFELLQPGHHTGKRSFWIWMTVRKDFDHWTTLAIKTDYQLATEMTRAQIGSWIVSYGSAYIGLRHIVTQDLELLRRHAEPSLLRVGLHVKEIRTWVEVASKTGQLSRQYSRLGQGGRFFTVTDWFLEEDHKSCKRPTLHVVFELELCKDPKPARILSLDDPRGYQRTGTVGLDQFSPQRQMLYTPISLHINISHRAINRKPERGHFPMIFTCVKCSPFGMAILVPTRNINGIWTGYYTRGQLTPNPDSLKISNELRTAGDIVIMESLRETLDKPIEPVPGLPSLSLLSWNPTNFFPNQSYYPVHLAVRLVNLLPSSWNLEYLALPPDITLTV